MEREAGVNPVVEDAADGPVSQELHKQEDVEFPAAVSLGEDGHPSGVVSFVREVAEDTLTKHTGDSRGQLLVSDWSKDNPVPTQSGIGWVEQKRVRREPANADAEARVSTAKAHSKDSLSDRNGQSESEHIIWIVTLWESSCSLHVTIQIEGNTSGGPRAVMEQCLPLEDLLTAEVTSEFSGKQGNSKVAAAVNSVISSFCAVYADRHEATLRE